MNYSDSFRRGPRRHYDGADADYGIGHSLRPSADASARERYYGGRDRPAPSSRPPRRDDAASEASNGYEEVVINATGPTAHRPPWPPRPRVDDEPEDKPGPSSRPSGYDRMSSKIEGGEPGDEYHERPRPIRLEERVYPPPPPRRASGRTDSPVFYDRNDHRRAHRVPPPPPPPYGIPVYDERRRERHHYDSLSGSRPLRHQSHPRPVTEGIVQVSPFLHRPDLPTGHDLASVAEQPNPKDDPQIRHSIVLCVYRHSKKAFDYRSVDLRTTGRRLDRDARPRKSDLQLFIEMRTKYERELRGWIRRLFSFKALSTVRLLPYGDGLLFRPEQEDDIFSSKFIKIWRNPHDRLRTARDKYEWIEWILDQKDLEDEFDMAIELIEDYVPDRIVFVIGLGLIAVVALTSVWLVKGGDPGLVATVMSFVLSFIAAIIALTAIWDWFDGERSKELQQRAVIVLPKAITPPEFLPPFGPGKEKGPKINTP